MADRGEESEKNPKLSIQDDRHDMLCELNKYRCCNRLCDVIIVVEGREFPAHRAVLTAGGGFFRGLFAADMKEHCANKVELFQVDPEIMDDILGYLYTGGMELSQDNAQQIIMAADFLLLDKLKAHADKFLAQFVQDTPTSDLLLVYQFANRYECEMYEKATLKSLQENFEAVIIESSDILELSAEDLHYIISADDLVVSNEEVVYRFVIDWVKHRENRKDLLYKMFSCIRLHSLSEEFLQSCITSEDLVSSDTDCSSLVHQRMTMPSTYSPSKLDAEHPRKCLDPYVNAICFVSTNCMSNDLIPWCFIPSQNLYYKFPMLYIGDENIDCQGAKLLHHRDKVFLFLNYTQGVFGFMFDLEMNSWSEVADVDCHTVSWSVTGLKDIIYIAGGRFSISLIPDDDDDDPIDDDKTANVVFACNVSHLPSTAPCSVQHVAPLNTARHDMHLVSDENYIYAIGGSLESYDDTEVVERYNPILDSWEYMSPMARPNSGFSSQCSVFRGKIFVIQGKDDIIDHAHNFDEVYDVDMDTWSQIPRAPVNTQLAIMPITSCGNVLYLLKYGDNAQIKSFTFDEQKRKWYETILSEPYKTVKKAHQNKVFDCPTATVVRLQKDMLSTYEALNNEV